MSAPLVSTPACTSPKPCGQCHYCQLAAHGPDYWARPRTEPTAADRLIALRLSIAVIWQLASIDRGLAEMARPRWWMKEPRQANGIRGKIKVR